MILKRFGFAILLLTVLCGASDLPLTIKSGQIQRFPSGDTIDCATMPAFSGTTTSSAGTCVLVSSIPLPQGRLTLVTGTPVMTSDQSAKSTIYYDCQFGKYVPYYDGSNDQIDTISGCEVSLTMIAGASTVGGDNTTSGGINNAGVFDVWWVHGGANRICIANGAAASHSGGGWSSDTSGSTTARGTGYSAVHNTRGYWTNTNAISHCWNGSTDYGSVSANQGTYLGSLYTTAAGQTTVQLNPTPASGGTNPIMGLWNAYNRVPVIVINSDNATSSTFGSGTGPTYRTAHSSSSNRVSWVDGLAQETVFATYSAGNSTSTGGTNCAIGLLLDATSGTPPGVSIGGTTAASQSLFNSAGTGPVYGFHFFQEMEGIFFGTTTCTFQYNIGTLLGGMGLHTEN